MVALAVEDSPAVHFSGRNLSRFAGSCFSSKNESGTEKRNTWIHEGHDDQDNIFKDISGDPV
jgi:hypothetical protein